MKTEVKITVAGLEVGMFVSRLDRPWIETPFMLEGVQIKSRDDIKQIKKYCNYVYVDIEQGVSPEARYWILSETPKVQQFTQSKDIDYQAKREEEKVEYASYRRVTYRDRSEFNKEVKIAEKAADSLSSDFNRLVKDLEQGRDLNIAQVEKGIKDMVDSIARNPAAMMWVAHLRKTDDYTYSRALGTSVWCATFGRQLGLEKSNINFLATGGLLLDLGKSQLPHELLVKTEALTEEEREQVKSHVDLSVKLLVENSFKNEKINMDIMQMVASHHERADGSGYPQGLSNADIPLFGRIAGIVDSYDAMTTDRPYTDERPKSPHEAVSELYELRGGIFQAELVEQFIQTVGLYPSGSLVELNTGEVGAVVAVNGLRRLRPTIMLLLDESKEPYNTFKHINLSILDEDIRVVNGLSPGAYGINMSELFL